MNKDKLQEALELATAAHKGQFDKAGVEYIEHPKYVSSKCVNIEEKLVALLHDVVEDSDVTLSEIEKRFTTTISEAVDCLTKRDGEEYFHYLQRVKSNKIATKVKIEDLTHNSQRTRIKNPTERDYHRLEEYKVALVFMKK